MTDGVADEIKVEEMKTAVSAMKRNKATGPDGIPAEVWKFGGEKVGLWLCTIFNKIINGDPMPNDWRKSSLVPVFKNKGDILSCTNYRPIKLLPHAFKIWERVINATL